MKTTKGLTAIKHALLLVNNHHGSGIDGTWNVTQNTRSVVCSNDFHCMDEHGYYCGWVGFKVIIPKRNPDKWNVLLDGSYLSRKAMIKDYLESIFSEELSDYGCTLLRSRLEFKTSHYINISL